MNTSTRLLLLFIFIFPNFISAQLEGEWFAKADMPTARKEVANAAVALGGQIYVVGGRLAGNQISTAFERYDPATDTWETLASYPFPVWRATAAVADGKIFVFGGYQSINPFPFNPSNKVHAYDPTSNVWTQRTDMLSARGAAAAVALNGNIHLIGGGANTALTTHHIYFPVSDSWTTEANLSQARSGLTANVLDGKIYACGGYFLSGGVISRNTMERYDPASGNWSFVNEMPIARLGLSSAVANGKLYVFGGETNGAVPTKTLEYRPTTDTWKQMVTIPEPVNFAGAAAVNDTIYLMGGGAVNLTADGIDKTFCFVPEMSTAVGDYFFENINASVFPNPIISKATFNIELVKKQFLSADVFDVTGRTVHTIFNGQLEKGNHSFDLQRIDFGEVGVYFILIKGEGVFGSLKILLE